MLTDLFSIFDPSISLFSLSWLSILFLLILIPMTYWCASLFSFIFTNFSININIEVDYIIFNPINGIYAFLGSIFLLVSSLNLIALFPFIFSLTSHLVVTLPLSYSFWIGIITFCWVSSLNHFLAHLIPAGTPIFLMSFIVLVETLSNLIRPLALTFRLTANIIAGHLLIGLIGGFLITLPFYLTLIGSLLQILLVLIELGVALIQAYVFSTLLLLYLSDSEH